jgi:CheY-like chemotaxis protein
VKQRIDYEILLVDDSTAHVDIVREALGGLADPRRLSVASNGDMALNRLFRRPPYEVAVRPALILLDFDLPGVHGLDVLTAIKSDAELRSIPVVLLIGRARAADVAACYTRGANSVVECPVDLDQFVATLRRVYLYWTETNVLRGC